MKKYKFEEREKKETKKDCAESITNFLYLFFSRIFFRKFCYEVGNECWKLCYRKNKKIERDKRNKI